MNSPISMVCGSRPASQGLRLGDWWLDPASGELSRPGERRHLPPQQMDLLAYLAANPGRLVTREELLAAVWHGAAVEEGALSRCVSEIRAALGDDARDPRYIETIPKRGYRLVAPGPEAGEGEPVPRPSSRPIRGPRHALAAAAALTLSAAVISGSAVVNWFVSRDDAERPGGDSEADALPGRRSVAVLDFADRSENGDLAWLGTALPGLLATDLARAEGVRVIPPELVTPLLDELALSGGAPLGDAALARVRQALGADLLVSGSFAVPAESDGGRVRIEVVVHAAAGEEPLAALVEEGAAAEATELAALLGARLRQRLGAGASPAPDREAQTAGLPRGPVALRLYFEGLQKLRRFEAPAARILLERSLAEEPERPLTLLALSHAWVALGSRARAAELSKRALSLSATLPREDRLIIEAQSLAASGRWDVAVEIYRGLWQRSLDNLEVGIHLARAQLSAGLPTQAEETVAEIRRRAGPAYSDPRLDLLEANTARALAEHEQALVTARRAARLGAEVGAELVVAHARWTDGSVLHAMGRVQEARAVLQAVALAFAAAGDRRNEARVRLALAGWAQDAGDFTRAEVIYQEALAALRESGDAAGEAQALMQLASLARDRSDFAQAEELARGALRISREIGERGGEAEALTWLGVTHATQGRFDQAAPLLKQALAIRRELGAPKLVATSLSNLGKLYLLQGDLGTAAATLPEAVALSREADLPDLLATVQVNLGYLHAEVGDLVGAEAAFAEAQSLFRKLENRRMLAASVQGLGEVSLMRADLAGARERLDEALSLRLAMGEQGRIAESRRALVELLVEQGDQEGAERMAREAMAAARAARSPAIAATRFVQALLATGRSQEALKAVDEVGSPDPAKRPTSINAFPWRIIAARVWAATGKVTQAKVELTALMRDAEALGAWRSGAEASLALGEIELREGADTEALARLSRLEADARARGFLLLAEKARAAGSADPPHSVAQRLPPPRPR